MMLHESSAASTHARTRAHTYTHLCCSFISVKAVNLSENRRIRWLYVGRTLAVRWWYIGGTLPVRWRYVGGTMAALVCVGCDVVVDGNFFQFTRPFLESPCLFLFAKPSSSFAFPLPLFSLYEIFVLLLFPFFFLFVSTGEFVKYLKYVKLYSEFTAECAEFTCFSFFPWRVKIISLKMPVFFLNLRVFYLRVFYYIMAYIRYWFADFTDS